MRRRHADEVTLREYVETLVDDFRRALEQHRKSQAEALRLASITMEHRLELLDELRGNVLPRQAFDEYVKASDKRYHTATNAIHARIDDLRDRLAVLTAQMAAGPPELRTLSERIHDEAGERISRGEYDSKHDALIRDIAGVRSDIAALATKVATGPPDLREIQKVVAAAGGEQRARSTSLQVAIAFGILSMAVLSIIVTIAISLVTGHPV